MPSLHLSSQLKAFDDLCKQFESRWGPVTHEASSEYKLFDTWVIYQQNFGWNNYFLQILKGKKYLSYKLFDTQIISAKYWIDTLIFSLPEQSSGWAFVTLVSNSDLGRSGLFEKYNMDSLQKARSTRLKG